MLAKIIKFLLSSLIAAPLRTTRKRLASNLLDALAYNVRVLRRERRLTQRRLAERSGIDLRTIQRIESSETNPSASMLAMLATALSVKPSRLLESIPDEPEPDPEK